MVWKPRGGSALLVGRGGRYLGEQILPALLDIRPVRDAGTKGEDPPSLTQEQRREIDATLAEAGVAAFSEVHVVPDLETGILGIAQANGFAGLESNTVIFGWADEEEGLAAQLRLLRLMSQLRMSTILARMPDRQGPRDRHRIDVWWGGLENNGDLMLLLAHLLNMDPEWRPARVRIRTIVRTAEEQPSMLRRLRHLVSEVRIRAEADVIVKPDDKEISEVMHEASAEADVVFLGLMVPEPGDELTYARRLIMLTEGFQTALFVRNGERFAGEMLGELQERAADE